jgi:hypothetical protein
MPLNLQDLKEKGANEKQLAKLKELWPKLEVSQYAEFRPWCFHGMLRVYFDADYIAINDKGHPHVFCEQEFIRKKIVRIIGG